jgi:hypothetical protein
LSAASQEKKARNVKHLGFLTGHYNGEFSLTPALSLWERENHSPVYVKARIGACAVTPYGFERSPAVSLSQRERDQG